MKQNHEKRSEQGLQLISRCVFRQVCYVKSWHLNPAIDGKKGLTLKRSGGGKTVQKKWTSAIREMKKAALKQRERVGKREMEGGDGGEVGRAKILWDLEGHVRALDFGPMQREITSET